MGSDDPGGRSPFMKMIEREYDNLIRSYFNTTANRNLSWQDNEDIFHNTIIKCDSMISEKGIDDEDEMKSYLFKSLKTNGYRESQYSRNKQRDNADDIKLDNVNTYQPNQEVEVDLNIIYDYIKDRYGEDTLDIIKRHLEGQSIREIEEDTGKKGLYYIITRTLKNIRRKFT